MRRLCCLWAVLLCAGIAMAQEKSEAEELAPPAAVSIVDFSPEVHQAALGKDRGPCVGDKDINGVATTTWDQPFKVYYKDSRTTSLYLASEFGCDGGPISGMRYYVATMPAGGYMMNTLTIRLKHTDLSVLTSTTFDNTGWTICYQANTLIPATGWYTFTFTTPFTYDSLGGTQNLLVDVCFNNSTYASSSYYVYYYTATANRSLYKYCDDCSCTTTDPLTWTTCSGVTLTTKVPRVQFIFPPPSTGACCVNFECVATNMEPECTAMGGTWYGGQNCATFYCPPWNDNCQAVGPVPLTPGIPVMFTGNNLGATNDCGSFPGGQVWHAVMLPGPDSFFDVWLDYCTTNNGGFPFGNAWLNWAVGCPCTGFTAAGVFDTTTCGDGNLTVTWSGLASGTYYYPVMLDPANHAAGNYTLHVMCMPSYCSSYATSTADETLKTVQFGTIDNTTLNCDTYDNFTYLSTDVIAGQTYPFNIVIGDCEGTSCYSKRLAIFIDLNQDYDFADAGERVYNSGQLANAPCPDFPLSGNFTVPASATVGCTRMRIVVVETSSADPVPCGTYTWGATEDYTVCIQAPPPEGACCFGTTCEGPMSLNTCLEAGGVYKGNGSDCDPNPCIGACCFPDGSCLETAGQAECVGNYLGDGTNCTPNLCPQPGNECGNPMPAVLSPGSLPYVDADTTCGRGNDYQDTCLGYYDGGEDMLYSVVVTEPMCVNIAVSGTSWVGVAIDTSCPPGATCLAYATSSGCCPVIQNVNLEPSLAYYIMIDTWPSPNCTDFTMTISACPPPPAACCYPDGSCALTPQEQCSGIWLGEGTTCSPNMCEPCVFCGPGPHFIDTCATGNDYLPSGALVGIDTTLDCLADTNLIMFGPVKVHRSNPHPGTPPDPNDPNHPNVIDTEIVSMHLTGGGYTLVAGAGLGQGGVLTPSLGGIAETLTDPAVGDSFFDVFFEVDLGGGVYAYNHTALRVQTPVTCITPFQEYIHVQDCIELYDSPTGGTHIANLVAPIHDAYPFGACCFPDGSCQTTTTELACQMAGGIFQGFGTTCHPNPCPPPPGACCYPDGYCSLTPQEQCSGIWLGEGTTCSPNMCEPCVFCGPGPHFIDTCPAGNDYLPSGALVGIDTTLDCLADTNLIMFGPVKVHRTNALDDSVNYPGTRPVDGHLDVIDTEILSMSLTGGGYTLTAGAGQGQAGVLTSSWGRIAETLTDPAVGDSFFDVFFEVDLGGGVYAYNHTALRVQTPVTCITPFQEYIHVLDCIELYDSPTGGTHIANLVAPIHDAYPFGACCFPDGSCQTTTTELACQMAGGIFQGFGTTCHPNPCPPPPIGACCFTGSVCQVLTPQGCAAAGGTFKGLGTTCDPNPCICRGDLNCDGVVDFGDINPFVLILSNFTAWQQTYPGCPPQNGDIDGNGSVGFEDINPFVALIVQSPFPCQY